MRKNITASLAGMMIAGLSSFIQADEIKNNFHSHMNQVAIDALTQDLGALVGGGTFHTGKALGFPVGFDVGVHVPIVTFQNDDAIMNDDGSSLAAVIGQVEAGLPGKVNLIGRFGSLADGKIYGGGLRYGILKPSVPGLPSLSVSGLYNKFIHDYVELVNYSANAVLSLDLPIVHPYIGVAYDSNKLEATDKAYVGAPLLAPANLESDESGYRAEVGVNLSIIPFTYVTLGAGLANGREIYHVGAGINF